MNYKNDPNFLSSVSFSGFQQPNFPVSQTPTEKKLKNIYTVNSH